MAIILNFLSLRGVFGTYDDAIFGLILIIIMLFAPHGLLRINYRSYAAKLFAFRQDEKEEA